MPPPRGRSNRQQRLLIVSVSLAAGWTLVLLLLVALTAGRAVVGVGQMHQADVIVIAERNEAGDDHVEVERVFKGQVEMGELLRVRNLSSAPGVEAGESYLFALTRAGDDFVITRLDSQRMDMPLLVYPSSASTISQVKMILRDGGRP